MMEYFILLLSYIKFLNKKQQQINIYIIMRNKKNLSRLVKQFIKSSPRSKAQNRNGILPPQYQQKLAKLPTDQQYIKNFITHIDCSYMYNYYGPPTINEHKMYLHKKSFVNPLSVGLIRKRIVEINDKLVQKRTILFQLIKLLNKDKHTILRYTEMQQFLLNLNVPEIKEFKKFLVFLYKWLLNQKYKFDSGSVQQELCQETSEIIIKRIYEAHEKGDVQLLRNTQQELAIIEKLQKARQFKRNSMFEQAKEEYQIVYFAKLAEQPDKVEALQYFIERFKLDKNSKLLKEIVEKIKERCGNNGVHLKMLNRAINDIEIVVSQPQNHELNINFQVSQQSQNKEKTVIDTRIIKQQDQNQIVKLKKQKQIKIDAFEK